MRAAIVLFLSLSIVPMLAVSSLANDLTEQLKDIELHDCRGAVRKASELPDSKPVVIAFLGTECPLAKLYGPKLQTLAERFSNDVVFVGVCSNVQDSPTEVAQYANKAGITFPMLMDPEQKLADILQAKRQGHFQLHAPVRYC